MRTQENGEKEMVNLETILELFDHMLWADAEVWKAVTASEKATADAKLRELLYHLHVVQRAFLRAWRGESFEEGFPQFTEARALRKWAISYYGEAKNYLSELDEEGLNRAMPLPWEALVERQIGRKPEPITIGETALQVAMHSTYHRGQVNARLRELGGEPPTVDFIIWVWLGRPAAEWN